MIDKTLRSVDARVAGGERMEIINCNQRIFALVICAVYSYAMSELWPTAIVSGNQFHRHDCGCGFRDKNDEVKKGIKGTL